METELKLEKSNKNFSLIKYFAYKYSSKSNVPFDELMSEGFYIYCKTLKSWNRSNGVKFTTFLYSCLKNELLQFCQRWEKHLPSNCETIDNENNGFVYNYTKPLFDITVDFNSRIKSLPKDSQEVISIIENYADEIVFSMKEKVKNPHKPKHIKGALKRILKNKGWEKSKIDKAFYELEKEFSC